jgi:hypothetical protein
VLGIQTAGLAFGGSTPAGGPAQTAATEEYGMVQLGQQEEVLNTCKTLFIRSRNSNSRFSIWWR